MLSISRLSRSLWRKPISRGIRLSINDSNCQQAERSTGQLSQGQKLATRRPSLLPFLATPWSGCSTTLLYGPPREWHRFLSSTAEPSESLAEYSNVDTMEYVELVASYLEREPTSAILIDVREPEELVESGQIPGTINIPLGDVESALSLEADQFKEQYGLKKPPLDAGIVFNCRAGVRSLVAIETANKLGYSRARHYVRGYLGWQDYMEESSEADASTSP